MTPMRQSVRNASTRALHVWRPRTVQSAIRPKVGLSMLLLLIVLVLPGCTMIDYNNNACHVCTHVQPVPIRSHAQPAQIADT